MSDKSSQVLPKGPKDFQKIVMLGKGGVGTVYLVLLKGTEKLFAMKILKKDEMISRNKVRYIFRIFVNVDVYFF